jgi:hypothetical protein
MAKCAVRHTGILVVLTQSRAETGRHAVVTRVFRATVTADAAVAGVVVGSVGAAEVRILLVARGVAEIAPRIHVRPAAVHFVLVVFGERGPLHRHAVREGAVAALTAVVVARVRLGGPSRQEDEGACGREQHQ